MGSLGAGGGLGKSEPVISSPNAVAKAPANIVLNPLTLLAQKTPACVPQPEAKERTTRHAEIRAIFLELVMVSTTALEAESNKIRAV